AGRDPYFEPLPHPRSDRSPPARVIGRESHRLRRPAAAAVGQRAAHLGLQSAISTYLNVASLSPPA
ncbi:MAG TPA: hypothetical protein VKA82_23190, partial [Rubrobacter sp.]|nr:hypothetical protein [Rubrobacter sp.]